jgi:hypothetical protein
LSIFPYQVLKNAATCDFDGDGRVLASGPLPRLKKNFRFFSHFLISRFAERQTLGKSAKALLSAR